MKPKYVEVYQNLNNESEHQKAQSNRMHIVEPSHW